MINKVTIVGRAGDAPLENRLSDTNSIVSFSIATDSGYKDKTTGAWVEKPQWHRINVFNKMLGATAMQRVQKGTLVYVEGSIEYRKYTDKDGIERMATNIVVGVYDGNLKILEKTGGGAAITPHTQEYAHAKNKPAPSPAAAMVALPDDDIPF